MEVYKGIDIYKNGEEYSPGQGERKIFIENKMMKFFKKINDSIFFSSDNKGNVYYLEFNQKNKSFKITNLNNICSDSKYILNDIINSSKYNIYFSLNLNPCLNIFKFKDNKKEIEILQHINLRKNGNKLKYNKVMDINTNNGDYFILFGEDIIELWMNKNYNNKNYDITNYECVYILNHININKKNQINIDDNKFPFILSNIYKYNNENFFLLNLTNFQILKSKILESNKNNSISPMIEINNIINIKGIEGQLEKISSLFIDKDYVFLGLADSLVLLSVLYGEIIQIYKIGKVLQIKITNDKKYVYIFVEKGDIQKKYYFIKYRFIEYEGLEEDSRINYKNWIYKFDIIEKENLIVIYDIKGLITLLSFN